MSWLKKLRTAPGMRPLASVSWASRAMLSATSRDRPCTTSSSCMRLARSCIQAEVPLHTSSSTAKTRDRRWVSVRRSFMSGALPRLGELVSAPPDGEDARGLGRVGLDLGAQAVDVGVDGVLVAFVLVAPDGVEQVHAREHLAGLARKEVQQVELARGQVQPGTMQPGIARHGVHGDRKSTRLNS